jgi:hypothetical protein
LAIDFKTIGHTWGVLKNLAEVPLFLDSTASRLVQLADIIAYSLYRKFEKNDERFSSIIEGRFDQYAGVMHGFHLLSEEIR